MNKLWMLGLIPVLSSACSPENNPARSEIIFEQAEQTGRITIPLTTIASSGVVYQMLLPAVYFAGPTGDMEVSLEGEQELSIPLEKGNWSMEVLEDFGLRKSVDDRLELVEAELISENPQKFQIIGGEVTSIKIGIRTIPSEYSDEEPEELYFEYGDLDIEFEIDDQATVGEEMGDTADEFEDTGEDFAPSKCQAGPPYSGPMPYNTEFPRELKAMQDHINYCDSKNCTADSKRWLGRTIVRCI
jgi:hypothetical protein